VKIGALVGAIACVLVAGVAWASPPAERAIQSGTGVLINDPDGHAHRTAPKRVGEYINLWCQSSTQSAQTLEVRTFFEAREVAFRSVICPAKDFPRRHQIFRVREVGVYGMVLDGGGFDSFVIRTHTGSGR
jgi:hypothetical protein